MMYYFWKAAFNNFILIMFTCEGTVYHSMGVIKLFHQHWPAHLLSHCYWGQAL